MTAATPLTTLPPGASARLSDGTRIDLRPLRDGERQPVLDVFEHMSAQSRYLRFFAPVPVLTESTLKQLTRLDGYDRVAWVAHSGDRCVGIVRFVRWADRPESAELAVSVVDEFHRRGLGRVLLGVLASVAISRGISAFTVTVHPENRGSLALLRSFPAPTGPLRLRFVEGAYEGDLTTAAILADERIRQHVDLDALMSGLANSDDRLPLAA